MVKSHGIQNVRLPPQFPLIFDTYPEPTHQPIYLPRRTTIRRSYIIGPKTFSTRSLRLLCLFYSLRVYLNTPCSFDFGWGRSSVGRDPETLLNVKILPNQRGLHPKFQPTVLCHLQSAHWPACPVPKLPEQNFNHNFQNMLSSKVRNTANCQLAKCQVIPQWP